MAYLAQPLQNLVIHTGVKDKGAVDKGAVGQLSDWYARCCNPNETVDAIIPPHTDTSVFNRMIYNTTKS